LQKPLEKNSFQFLHCWLKVRHCQKFLEIETNKRAWSISLTPCEEATKEEADGSARTGTLDPTRPKIVQRPIGRKQDKQKREQRPKEMLEHTVKPL
jgi:hypothetical protein